MRGRKVAGQPAPPWAESPSAGGPGAPHQRFRAILQRRGLAPVAVLALGAILLFAPLPPLCLVRAITGFPCPTCGMTRAARHLFQGDVAGALALHPLVVAVVPALAVLGALELITYVRTGEVGSWSGRTWVTRPATGLAVLLVLVWAARFLGAFGGPAPV